MKTNWTKSKGVRIAIVAVLLLAAGAVAYWRLSQPAETEESSELKTAQVRVGDIKIGMSAVGELVAAREVTLGFDTPGRLDRLAVELGQEVEAGDLLASLAFTDAQAAVQQAELALRSAELKRQELDDEATQAARDTALANLNAAQVSLDLLLAGPDAEALATSQAILDAQRADVAAAQALVASAQENVSRLVAGPAAEDLSIAERKVEQAKNILWGAQGQRDAVCGRPSSSAAECDLAQANVQKNEEDVAIAQLQLELVRQGPSAAETASAQAQLAGARGQLANAQSQVIQAQASYETLRTGPGADVIASAEARVAQAQQAVAMLSGSAQARAVESAELAVAQAQLNLDLAKGRLERLELRAPFAGRVVRIEAQVGEQVGSAPVISLASTLQGMVRFYVEETDLGLAAVGAPVQVVFRAAPELVYTGQISWMSPLMSSVDGVASAETLASIDLGEHPEFLLPGMEADVEVITALAENALLVPAEAIRPLGADAFAVFVVGQDGQLELRTVELGLRDFSNAQIISGLIKGEVVSTGTVETD